MIYRMVLTNITLPEAQKYEQILREYILNSTETVKLTRINLKKGFLTKIFNKKSEKQITEEDPRFVKAYNLIAPFLISKEQTTELNQTVEHHYFSLTVPMKQLFDKSRLFEMPLSDYSVFFGYWCPKFYQRNQLKMKVIDWDFEILEIELSDIEKQLLESKGIDFSAVAD